MNPITVVFENAYGELQQPVKAGFSFVGWMYEGVYITAETKVTMTGEHILTAIWE